MHLWKFKLFQTRYFIVIYSDTFYFFFITVLNASYRRGQDCFMVDKLAGQDVCRRIALNVLALKLQRTAILLLFFFGASSGILKLQ